MDQSDKENVAKLVREGRTTKGYTQQELSDLAGISLRSVQRIENGEVIPRAYTLRIIAEKLDLPQPLPAATTLTRTAITSEPAATPELAATPEPATSPESPATPGPAATPATRTNTPRKLILTICIGLLILLGIGAFIAQSPKFPETDFERFLVGIGAITGYSIILLRIWK